jgi:hypothetical protein
LFTLPFTICTHWQRILSPVTDLETERKTMNRSTCFLLVVAAAGLPLLGGIAPAGLSLVLGSRPALAAVIDDSAPEAAPTSRLISGLVLPAGAFRLNDADSLGELRTQLANVAKESGFVLGKMEAVVWGGKGHNTARNNVLKSGLKQALAKAGYRYETAAEKKTDDGLVTFFVVGKEGANEAVLGFTVAGDDHLVLTWGQITPSGPQVAAKQSSVKTTAPDSKSATNKAKLPDANQKRLDTELGEAIEAGKTDQVTALLKQGASANARWGEGEFQQAVLMRAVMRGSVEMVAALLKAGADPEYGNGRDATPLFIAAILGEADIIETLLDGGAKIDSTTPDKGFTALHGSAITGKEDAAKRLLDRGAPKDKRDKDGKTPLDIAAGQKSNPVADLLR